MKWAHRRTALLSVATIATIALLALVAPIRRFLGFGGPRTAPNHQRSSSVTLSGPALRFGSVRYLPVERQKRDSAPYVELIRSQLGRPVELLIMETPTEAEQGLRSGSVDIVTITPLAYVKLKEAFPQAVLLTTDLLDGGSTYQGILVTRMSSNLSNLTSLRGKRVCWTSPTSASGYLYPRALLRAEGLDPDASLVSVPFTGDHLASMRAVKDGTCDAAGVFANALWGVKEEDGLSPGEFKVIGTTAPIPLDAIVARPDLPQETRIAVLSALLSMRRDSPAAEQFRKAFNRIDGFIGAKDNDYDGVREVLRAEEHAQRMRIGTKRGD